jgi:hypothetical protein
MLKRFKFCRTLPDRPAIWQPHLEPLEPRLPPGDALLGALLGTSVLGQSLTSLTSTGEDAEAAQRSAKTGISSVLPSAGSETQPTYVDLSSSAPISGPQADNVSAGPRSAAVGEPPALSSLGVAALLAPQTKAPPIPATRSALADQPSISSGIAEIRTAPTRADYNGGVQTALVQPGSTVLEPAPEIWLPLATGTVPQSDGAQVAGAADIATGNGNNPGPLVDSTGDVSLVPDKPSPQLVGDQITWTATAANSGDHPVFQFSVGPTGGPLRMVRDYSLDNTFTWAPMAEGNYDVKVSVKDDFGGSETASLTASDTVNSRVAGTSAVIAPTANPLVALYSAPPSSDQTMHVNFRPAGTPDAPWMSTDSKAIAPGQSTNFLVAGMLPSTTYQMMHVTDRGASPIELFTTGSLPTSGFPNITVTQAAGPRSDLTQGMIFHSALNQNPSAINVFATDLMGNVDWYYDPVAGGLNSPFATSLVPGGTALLIGNAPAGYGSSLREVDLAGNLIRETNVDAINAQLNARGLLPIEAIHHDAQRLPNGKTAILTQQTRTVDINGTPRQYQGDVVIVLDENFQVSWTWNSFDYLDVNRGPIGEDTTHDPVDWLHSNAVAWSPVDNNLIVSVRHQDWVIKINYANGTGDGHIIWRLGKDGDFTIDSTDPYPWFSHQHNAWYVDNNTLVLFDNGNTRIQQEPDGHNRGQVLRLDEQAHQVTPLLNVDLGVVSPAVGSAQRLPNGNYVFTAGLLGGFTTPSAQVTEVLPDGTTSYVLEMSTWEYRSFRVNGLYGVDVIATAASLNNAPANATINQAVSFTLTVTPTRGSGTPTGPVTFLSDGVAFGTTTLVNGTATITSSALSAGSHVITATYGGDGAFGASAAMPQIQVVHPGSIEMTLTSSLSPVRAGQTVTFTATVTTQATGNSFTPGGTVTFFDGTTQLGQPVNLTNGRAVFSTASLSIGVHWINARYSGDSNFVSSAFSALPQVVRAGEFFALGSAQNKVQVRRTSDGSLVVEFSPFGASYTGGVTVAMGDVNGDGYEDLIVGSATGSAHVKVYDGRALADSTFTAATAESHLITQFMAYDSRFGVGVNVAAAYVTGSPNADIITGTTSGNPHVKVYNSDAIASGTFGQNPDSYMLAQFFAYSIGANMGVTVAGGNIDGNRYADIVTGTTSGTGQVNVYSGRAIRFQTFDNNHPERSLLTSFTPYASNPGVGVNVAVGDVNGDGFADLITAPARSSPDVRVFDGRAIANGTFDANHPDASRLDQFFAFDPVYGTGVTLSVSDFTGSGRASILTGASTSNPHYRLVDGQNSSGTLPQAINGIDAIVSDFQGGVYVGA